MIYMDPHSECDSTNCNFDISLQGYIDLTLIEAS